MISNSEGGTDEVASGSLPIVRMRGASGWKGEALSEWREFDFAALPWKVLRREGQEENGICCVKASNSRRVLRVEPGRGGNAAPRAVFAKRYLANTWRRRTTMKFAGGKASREFHLGRGLLERGIATPSPLSWSEHRQPLRVQMLEREIQIPPASYLLTLEWPNEGSIRDVLASGNPRHGDLMADVAGFLAHAHRVGVYHDDCSAEHILVGRRRLEDRSAHLAFIDLDNGSLDSKPLPPRLRISNLFQILRSLQQGVLSRESRISFVAAYRERATESALPSPDRLIEAIDNLSARKVGRSVVRI